MESPHQSFHYRNDQLCCEDVSLESLAEEVGTPCYVYSRQAVLSNFRAFRAAFSTVKPQVCYAVKANSNLSVLRLLKEEGSGFDVVSAGEIHRLLAVGADPSTILFSGVGKTRSELETALDLDLLAINVESMEELQLLGQLASSRGKRCRVSLRMNPDVQVETHPYISTGLRQHKFGIDISYTGQIIDQLKRSPQLELVAVGCHIGSQILEVEPFLAAFVKIRELADQFRERGLPVRHLDLGGGIGIPYRGEARPDLDAYASFIAQRRGDYGIVFEPGRYIVGDAGILLNQVVYRKVNQDKNFMIVDGAMNDLMRPSLYQAHHEVLPLLRRPCTIKADLVGPVCESGDFFARDREIPDLQPGDYLAVMNAGAYGFVLSSNYNSRPRSAEILVEGNQYRVVRQRETLSDLIEAER